MKVLIIASWKPRRGGIVTNVENLIKRSKVDYTILTYRDRKAGGEKNVIRAPYINLPILRGMSFAAASILMAMRTDFDLIHAHYAVPQGFAGAVIKKLKKTPLILTVHGSDLTILGGSTITRSLVRWVLRSSDKIITVSKFMKRLVEKMGVEDDRVKVIYNGVNIQNPARGDVRRLIYVGAFVKQKGVDILIRAFKDIQSKIPDIELVLVGDGPERKRLQNLAADLGIRDVRFTGMMEDLDPFFTERSVFVLPSREEGFGIAILEAMERGVPVVASRVGGIVEIVQDGKSGLLFERENPEALSSAVMKIFGDDRLMEELVKNGKKRASEFSWDVMAMETEDVYREIIKKGA